jgi:signal transduction histidine kinase
MRVQAALASRDGASQGLVLSSLAQDLAHSRADLRRLVSGITPSALGDGDLATAMRELVSSFGADPRGPRLTLDLAVDGDVPEPVQVALYRCVAEGVTNALRHGRPATIEVSVRQASGPTGTLITAAVVDDGSGGTIVPGVGLSSLERRAAELGGRLQVTGSAGGTRLCVELPVRTEGASR